ncbi:MAG: hypothetical protein U5K56_01990 [Halioglobus sp.]|nr:hypothetical protein [Halioglobus sp.]
MVTKDGRTNPSRKHVETCERLGIKVLPTDSNRDVYKLIQEAIKKPHFKAVYDELEQERQSAYDKERKAESRRRNVRFPSSWEKLCKSSKQYATVFRRGKQIKWDILELEDVTSDEVKLSSIRVEALSPKKRKGRDVGEYLEWEKEVRLEAGAHSFDSRTTQTNRYVRHRDL